MSWEAQGKTFLITGGASGLGAAYAEGFLVQGAKSIAILDIAEEVGKATAQRLNNAYPDKVTFIKCDVGKEDDIAHAFDQVVDMFKQLDVIINNAGVMVDAPDMWRTACNVNWEGLVSFTLKGIKHMSKDTGGVGGTIINISSTVAITRSPFLPIYSGSKSAVLHFSRCLAMGQFYETTGIRILTLCLGPTDTPLFQNMGQRTYDAKLGQFIANSMPEDTSHLFQRVDSAVTALVGMFENGPPGSVWISISNKQVKNITPVLDNAIKEFEKEVFENHQ